jgi:hypothetical protein
MIDRADKAWQVSTILADFAALSLSSHKDDGTVQAK